MRSKYACLVALERMRLLRSGYRLYELVEAARGARGPATDEGLPVPPPLLRMRVAGTPDATWFLESGRWTAEKIAAAAERNGAPLAEACRILDFGCGCGRVIRHWQELHGVEVYGTDYGQRLVSWCAQNLSFATFSHNGLAPPLDYEDEPFDVVYAVSVFTHLPEELGERWLDELFRVLAPGGLLIATTHGDHYFERMTPEERERYKAGKLVVRRERIAGTNLCIVFHPEEYVRERYTHQFELLEHVSGGAGPGTPQHDLLVLRRPGSEGSYPASTA